MKTLTDSEASSLNLRAGFAFVVSVVAAICFAVLYVISANNELQGLSLGVAFLAFGFGLIFFGHASVETLYQKRHIPPPAREGLEEEQLADEAYQRGATELARRRFLKYMVGAAGAIGVAAVFPIASLGPRPDKRELFSTAWTAGSRVVDGDGNPVRLADLAVGSAVVVFPEGHVDDPTAQTVLIRLSKGQNKASPAKASWAPDDTVAYSRVCTHAGCDVAEYESKTERLLCPCHQSMFDVTNGAHPTFGPAARPLPQLPLYVDENGELRAQSDFHEAVGPSFWGRP